MVSILISLSGSCFFWLIIMITLNRFIGAEIQSKVSLPIEPPKKTERVVITPAAVSPLLLLCVGIILMPLVPELTHHSSHGFHLYHAIILVFAISCSIAYIHLLRRMRGPK